jgi:hypothetical protein
MFKREIFAGNAMSVKIHLTFVVVLVSMVTQSFARPLGPDCAKYFETNYPFTEFRLIGQGGAIDKRTGLMWFRCNAGEFWYGGSCRGSIQRVNWHQAKIVADEATVAGYEDWRLPTVDELKGLVEKNCINPAINPYVFPSVGTEVYWTSEDNFFNKYLGWGVFFFNGNDFARHDKTAEHPVLLVRDQDHLSFGKK